MNNPLRVGLCVVPMLILGTSARAEEKVSMKQKQERAAAEAKLADELKSVNETCGSTITETIAWSTFKGPDLDKYSVKGYCTAPLSAARNLCGSDAGKEGVQKGLKKITCAYGGEGKRSATLKDGALSWKIDWKSSNDMDFVKSYLENNL